MNSLEQLKSIEDLKGKKMDAFKKQELLDYEKALKAKHKKRRMKEIVGVLFVVLLIIAIYVSQFLFDDSSKSHAMEISAIKQELVDESVKMPEEKKDKTTEIDAPVKKVAQPVEQKENATVVRKTVTQPTVKPAVKVVAPVVPVQDSIYNVNIPMPKGQQEYLYKLVKQRGLDYRKTLAVIKHESVFNVNEVSDTNDYGYFQINSVNHRELAETLGTSNDPLNPYINMNWGTYMLADLYDHWRTRGYRGQALDEAVWSSYNKGLTGFSKYGPATAYINKMNEAIGFINSQF